ncbi:MAG: GNAT family N-acetyltransferase [Oscillatoriales cyanobacterium]|nr:MAG: GNAT family N-acetyltransferase [Oscillatoriales cyanobacterium]
MTYTHRLATPDDAPAIAPLWEIFAHDRAAIDPALQLKPDFDYLQYIQRQLQRPHTHTWILQTNTNEIVGCLIVYCYDEAPPPNLPAEFQEEQELDNPFLQRRVGSVLGLYIQPEHRNPTAIQLLTNAALAQAEEIGVSDIDILTSSDQTGIHTLLERAGFTKAAVQYCRHYNLDGREDLISLHIPHPEISSDLNNLKPQRIPLRNPETNQPIHDPHGNPIYLEPIENAKTADGLYIYPTPVRDPNTQAYIFDGNDQLVTCPLLRDNQGQPVFVDGLPQFKPPKYRMENGQLSLERDADNQVCFE